MSYQENIFKVTKAIPKGRVTTYGAIADFLALGSARMVGWALNKCHVFGDVPAHRVVNVKGELSGRLQFVTPTAMQERLEAEGTVVKKHKVVEFADRFWHPSEDLDQKNFGA